MQRMNDCKVCTLYLCIQLYNPIDLGYVYRKGETKRDTKATNEFGRQCQKIITTFLPLPGLIVAKNTNPFRLIVNII